MLRIQRRWGCHLTLVFISTAFGAFIPVATAEPILLADLSLGIGPGFFPGYDGGPVLFSFRTGISNDVGGHTVSHWSEFLDESQAGAVINAPADVVAGVNTALAHPQGSIGIQIHNTAFDNTIDYVLDGGWSQPGNSTPLFHSYVADLRAHTVSDITFTIDAMDDTVFGPNHFLEAAMTVRIFGEPVPEPASGLLAVCVVVAHLNSQRRAANNGGRIDRLMTTSLDVSAHKKGRAITSPGLVRCYSARAYAAAMPARFFRRQTAPAEIAATSPTAANELASGTDAA